MITDLPQVACPKCSTAKLMKIVYGFPLPSDLSDESLYGGEWVGVDSDSHYCADCGLAWSEPGIAPEVFPFPERCCFCHSVLTSGEKLAFSVEYEDWIAAEPNATRLSDDTFLSSLFPVCGACRSGIRENLADIEAEAAFEERQRRLFLRIWLAIAAVFALVILCALVFG